MLVGVFGLIGSCLGVSLVVCVCVLVLNLGVTVRACGRVSTCLWACLGVSVRAGGRVGTCLVSTHELPD